MKAKWLSFTFICFSKSGLFNGLRPIQIKKFLPPVSGCIQGVQTRSFLFAIPSTRAVNRVVDPANRMSYSTLSGFWKLITGSYSASCWLGGGEAPVAPSAQRQSHKTPTNS
jgi:hypothetical protein